VLAPEFRHRPPSVVAVRFFALGLLGYVALAVAVLARPGAAAIPPGPGGIFLLHLAVLGWISPVMIGADYQLIPVVLRRPLPNPRLAEPVFAAYVAGVPLFLWGWVGGPRPVLAVGGALVGGALLGFVAHALSALGRPQVHPVALGLAGGLVCLAGVAVLGPWMALALGTGRSAPFGAVVPVHAALGLGGWLLLTMVGASYQLVPFFAATPPGVRARWGLLSVATVGGGVALVLAAVAARGPAWPGAALALLGLSLWAADLGRLAWYGRQARREPATASALAALSAVWLGAVGALASVGGIQGFALPAAYLGVVVAPSLLAVGQLQKILPFLAAWEASAAARRRGAVPKTEALFPRRYGYGVLAALLVGYASEVLGFALHAQPAVRAGAAVVLAGALAFVTREGKALAVWRGARRGGRRSAAG
jgi:hypothetical protein